MVCVTGSNTSSVSLGKAQIKVQDEQRDKIVLDQIKVAVSVLELVSDTSNEYRCRRFPWSRIRVLVFLVSESQQIL